MSSPQRNTARTDLRAIAEAIKAHDRFLLVTHENPDGDALGSILAAKLALEQLDKDVVIALYGDVPLPGEYAFMALDALRRDWPDDVETRVLLALDCANESRIAETSVLQRAPLVLNVDHHHDNTRFGAVNLVVSYLLRTDFTDVGAAEPYSEGIIDYLRAVEGAEMAVLIREPPRTNREGPARRVSLRSSVDELDVSAIARRSGGGGHRQAAGFSSEDSIEEITAFVRREFAATGRSAA